MLIKLRLDLKARTILEVAKQLQLIQTASSRSSLKSFVVWFKSNNGQT